MSSHIDLMDGNELQVFGRDMFISEDYDSDDVTDSDSDMKHEARQDLSATVVSAALAGAAAVETVMAERTSEEKTGSRVRTHPVSKARDLRQGASPIRRRWTELTFYLMACMAILLPVLFLVLTSLILAMDGKSDSSNWGRMVDPIKISVTAWPIVFAAVTAQGFKTWATFRVERGVRLMELEQLVGSHSVGSVLKQPFFLRRLDALTLFIFLIWSLSPLGSQALQRVYTLDRGLVSDNAPVLYVPLLGENRLLSPGVGDRFHNASNIAEHWQMALTYFMAGYIPEGERMLTVPESSEADRFGHPYPRKIWDESSNDIQYFSHYGLPVVLSPPAVQYDEALESKQKKEAAGGSAQFETINFPIISSVFNFTCDDWRLIKREDIHESLSFSISQTMGLKFSTSNPASSTGIDWIQFATLQDSGKVLDDSTVLADNITVDFNWGYATIGCSLEQVFYSSSVTCWREGPSRSFHCFMDSMTVLPTDQVFPEWHTNLTDFSEELVLGANPYSIINSHTSLESILLGSSDTIDGAFDIESQLMPLATPPSDFAKRFTNIFNTFLTLAHCPECVNSFRITSVAPELVPPGTPVDPYTNYDFRLPPAARELYKPASSDDGLAARVYSPPGLIFAISRPWAWTLFACVLVLLMVGIASVAVESMLVAPDVLGYASTLARNNRHLHLPETATAGTAGSQTTGPTGPMTMSGSERARLIGDVRVMVQDVKPHSEVGKIALGLKHDGAERLKRGRLYR
ncbi:hypothetical protein V8F33_013254 [Rhypophila sp. PSN 637]